MHRPIEVLLSKLHRDDFLKEIERLLPTKDFFYLAGPMSGREKLNFPLFDSVSAKLREEGHCVASPAEFDHEEVRKQVMQSDEIPDQQPGGDPVFGSLWEDCLARDVVVVCHPRCVGLVLLPEWWQSNGALFETGVASKLGKPLLEYDPETGWTTSIDRDLAVEDARVSTLEARD